MATARASRVAGVSRVWSYRTHLPRDAPSGDAPAAGPRWTRHARCPARLAPGAQLKPALSPTTEQRQKSIGPASPRRLPALRRGAPGARDRAPQCDCGGRMRRRCVLLLALACLLAGWTVLAWPRGDVCHMVVCEIAFQELNDHFSRSVPSAAAGTKGAPTYSESDQVRLAPTDGGPPSASSLISESRVPGGPP